MESSQPGYRHSATTPGAMLALSGRSPGTASPGTSPPVVIRDPLSRLISPGDMRTLSTGSLQASEAGRTAHSRSLQPTVNPSDEVVWPRDRILFSDRPASALRFCPRTDLKDGTKGQEGGHERI